MTWLWSPPPGTTWLLWWPYSTNTHNLVQDDQGSGCISHTNLSATWDCSPSWQRCPIDVVDTFQYLGSTVFDDWQRDHPSHHQSITRSSASLCSCKLLAHSKTVPCSPHMTMGDHNLMYVSSLHEEETGMQLLGGRKCWTSPSPRRFTLG